ncbi:MAG: cytochrome P460 family protein [Thermodesulfovibrionales bacterium]|nr:cytochrome P460 family protein [Thermodesulfovibrionales bacterium]
MKRMTVFVLSVFFVLGLGVAAYAIHEIIPSETQIVMPGPNAEKLNEYIVRYDPYTAWELWPKKGKLYKGTEPHGSLLTTFINNTAHFSIKKKKGMEDGSIIAKENYTAEKKFVALTVMYKIKGYNPTAGDWFWAKYNPDGTVAAAGRVKGCIDCHSAKKDNDYIFTGEVKK